MNNLCDEALATLIHEAIVHSLKTGEKYFAGERIIDLIEEWRDRCDFVRISKVVDLQLRKEGKQ
jgi:hypothetical protein